MRRVLAWITGVLLVGSIQLVHPGGSADVEPEMVEVGFAPLAAGSSAGVNMTNATTTVTGTLLSTTDYVLYLNNTNASGPYHARISLVSASGVSNLVDLTVGIDNGAQQDQVTGSLGGITSTGGGLVALAASSTNRIFVTQSVSISGVDSNLVLEVVVADDLAESARYVMRINLTVT